MGHWKEIAMDMQERKSNSRLASVLGISEEDLEQLDPDIEADYGNDDAVYGYIVQFSESSPKEILRKISRLEKGNNVYLSPWEFGEYDDYDQDEYEEQYEAIISDKNYHQKFLDEINNLRKLNEVNLEPDTLKPILKRQIFISVIGALETFLSDTFVNLTFENDEYFKSFIETHPEFKQRKFELREIFIETSKLKETAKKVMLDMIYHNLPTISQMFTATFKVPFPNIKTMYALVLKRHDLVHRNGKTKEGIEVITDTEAINNLIEEAVKFVDELSTSLQKTTIDPVSDDPDDDLPF